MVQAWWSRKWLPRFPLEVLATLGRNSLYAFLLHLGIAFVVAQYQITYEQWIAVELVPIATIAVIYYMARNQIARRWIPN
jgi:fucose 4-O-acetylase-like acetyltransferase